MRWTWRPDHDLWRVHEVDEVECHNAHSAFFWENVWPALAVATFDK